ncbi:histidine kinase [Rhodanobacter sp. MP1X3]|uniref:sensor histidine kinase n=1 Tax=Rhodanobacter sp. MP1X3 TaxID=2723086 RepID=UPI00160EEC20|nr:histidine kinase [Rhodanobacter sp. MP1X3]MBB6244774.1 two-component system sensor histidine kinase AlgZ [Rhodanobacter sp. MP1X3]
MRDSRPVSGPRRSAEHGSLPDFCNLPMMFALLVIATLTATTMWLASDSRRDWNSYSIGILFATWLALVIGLVLCALRSLLQRLPGKMPYVGTWLVIMPIVAGASMVAHEFNDALQLQLVQSNLGIFVRDNVAVAALLGAGMLRYFYVLAQWQARLAAVTQAQVEALQARIRPHFLFNSMNTVAALIRIDPAAAERTVEDLSELFRAALGQHDTGDGTLGDELALVERYLAIEQLRLGARLHVRRELDDLPADFPLPRLLLQPLVENAVRHGVQPLREGGDVTLRGQRDGKGVRIEICNPLPVTPPEAGNGHGLDSVRQRVAYRYGPLAKVQAGPQGDRFVVLMQLPGPSS